MSDTVHVSSHSFVTLPLDAKRRVDRVCLEFERAARPARIESYLDRVEPEFRPALLAELVAIDVELRRGDGETPTEDEYLSRFPDAADAVRGVFRQANGPAVGGRLGKYLLTGVLGRGGMGVVYEAIDPVIDRAVAVKVLPDRLLADPAAHDRLLHEARLAGQLLHPNVVTLFEVGEADGVMFLVLERVSGGSAADRIAKAGPLDWRTATTILADVCRGLVAIHAAGFLHLDIKPANILLPAGPAGGAKLTDFSLAITGDTDGPGVVAGTPAYMSPEQRVAGPVSPRTDVYGLGAAYFALLTGRAPFVGDTLTEVTADQLLRPEPDPQAVHPTIPDAAARVVRRAMATDPDDRHPSAAAVLAELEALLGPVARRRRGRVARVLIAALGLVGAAFTFLAVAAMLAVAMVQFEAWPVRPSVAVVDPPAPAPPADAWEPLFNGVDLAGWHPVPFDLGDNPSGAFSVSRVDDQPVLRASGEGQCGIETDGEYENFYLRFEYRWGTEAGRHLASVRYHCTGPLGAKGTHGMELHRGQAGSYVRLNDLLKIDRAELRDGVVVPAGPAGRSVRQRSNREVPIGWWNQAAVVCVGDWSVHALNGAPVLALARSRRPAEGGDAAVTRGRVRLQSLAGEIYFRKVEVRPATELPAEYRVDLAPPPEAAAKTTRPTR